MQSQRIILILFALFHCTLSMGGQADRPARPNIVVLLAGDMGYGDLGCFGQKTLKTPILDAMAAEGMRFTQFYAGNTIGAASRCVMLTGRHAGRAAIRGNSKNVIAIPSGQPTVASLLKDAGYATACIGEWGLGTSSNLIDSKSQAGQTVPAIRLDASDRLIDDALSFVRSHQKSSFFLLLSLNISHANTEIERQGTGVDKLGEFAAKDWPNAEKEFAATIRNIDRDAGRVLELLKELGIEKNTLVVFTSDNGPNQEGGRNTDFFDSNGKHRGAMRDLLEGGIRVPMIAWWPGTIAPGGENDRQWYAGDLFATAAELAGVKAPEGLDSDSFVAALHGQPSEDKWKRKSPLYWEVYEGRTAQAVRFGKWKAIRSPMFTGPIELYDMSNDPGEKHDYSVRRPQLTQHAANLMNKHHHPDPNWKVPEPANAR